MAAALFVAVALILWVTPVNVPGTNLVPFGCGSPAAPTGGELAQFVCTKELDTVKTLTLVMLIVAGVLAVVGEVATSRWGHEKWFLGLIVAAPVALPILGWSIASLFIVVGAVGADGTLIRCGTAIAPATDTISVGLCGQLAERRLSLGLGGALIGAGALVGAAYVSHGSGARSSDAALDTPEPAEPESGGPA